MQTRRMHDGRGDEGPPHGQVGRRRSALLKSRPRPSSLSGGGLADGREQGIEVPPALLPAKDDPQFGILE
jgi:hypothetical protein